MDETELTEKALRLYARAISIVDPIRLNVWGDLGLTMAQLRVIFILREYPGLPAGLLADRLRVSPPTITGLVDRLVRLDLVRRDEDPEDRRLARNCLTEKGRQVAGDLERTSRAYMTEVFRRIGPEQLERLVDVLQLLSDAAEAVETPTISR